MTIEQLTYLEYVLSERECIVSHLPDSDAKDYEKRMLDKLSTMIGEKLNETKKCNNL